MKRRWLGLTAAGLLLAGALTYVIVIKSRPPRRHLTEHDRPALSLETESPAVSPFHEVQAKNSDVATIPSSDWSRFRGPQGNGVSADENVPLEWSDTKNLRWKAELPGPGSSSPIIWKEQIFVSCYSGYGDSGPKGGEMRELKRHLICFNRADGRRLWMATVDAVQPEDPYRGYLTEHGYASSTPVCDGEAVYVFFGKSGVLAFDLSGKQLWQTSVGTSSDNRGWGSASSPVLHKNLVIVNAASESRSIRALDKKTGREVWKAPGSALDLSFNTPVLVPVSEDRTDLVVTVPDELWGLNPDTGKLLWHAAVPMTGNVCPSVLAQDGIVYATGGYQGKGTVAVRAGGKGDVTKTHIVWTARESSYVASPVLHDDHLYWVNEDGLAVCVDAKTGKGIYKERLPQKGDVSRAGKPVYASGVLSKGRLYVPTRTAGVFVLAAQPTFEVLHHNVLSDSSDFNASPAVSGGQLFLRSNRFLYCIGG